MRRNTAYAVYGINLIVVVLFWFVSSGTTIGTSPAVTLLAVARLLGLLAASSALSQLILISRIQWVEERLGMDQLSQIHHQNGFLVMGLVLVHPALVTLSHSMLSSQSAGAQFVQLLRYWDSVGLAFTGLLVFAVVFGTATVVRKKLSYETWHTLHVLAYLAIGLTPFHQFTVGGDITGASLFRAYWFLLYGVAAGGLVVYRFARPLAFYLRHRFEVQKVVQETDDVTSIYIVGRKLDHFPVRSGQFMILKFLDKAFWRESHPFSLSCLPNSDYLRVTIKSLGDYTSTVHAISPGTKVFIDGPHGALTSRLCQGETALLVAGGIGVTPIRSLTEEFVSAGKDVVLFYCNRRADDIVFADEFEELAQRDHMTVHHVLSREPGWNGESGHLDGAMLERLVPGLPERECFLCGPVRFMDAITEELVRLGARRSRIHYERFSL